MMIETERLRLRPPNPSDAQDLFRFLGDRNAMRFTHVQASLDECRRYLEGHEGNRERVGYAPWVILDRSDLIVGFGGLYEDPFDPGWGLEIGYYFAPEAWGKGYASELVRYCLDLVRQDVRLSEVGAFAHPDNAASRHVLMKSGFRQERLIPSMSRYFYRLALRNSA
ncbi:GNAT family N-acetyltransferase [Microvirga roseola]|uniref:GNAT family N-acetyltransferase n=1 Tax=Microvirga roseola TaxID=2883126 RepID=UPI001E2F247C|nr:GNAT family N-acetyltransferase [Microvirga roseola]